MRAHSNKRNGIGMVVEAPGSGAIVGYMAYKLYKDHIVVKKCEAAINDTDNSIKLQMLDALVGKLSSRRGKELVFAVSENDSVTLALLRQCGFRASGIEKGQGQKGEDLFSMRYELAKNKGSIPSSLATACNAAENKAYSHKQRLSPADTFEQARQKLTALTRMEWEIVKPDAGGKLVAAKPADLAPGNPELYFQTRGTVARPMDAYTALNHCLGNEIAYLHANAHMKNTKVIIAAEEIIPYYQQLGSAGELAPAFQPSDRKARFTPSFEVSERENHRRG